MYVKWEKSQEPDIKNHMMLAERYIEGLEDRLKGSNDNNRILKASLYSKKTLLDSCEKALKDRDEKIKGYKSLVRRIR